MAEFVPIGVVSLGLPAREGRVFRDVTLSIMETSETEHADVWRVNQAENLRQTG